MKSRPLSNPPNPWSSTEVEYLEPPPASSFEVWEDHTRSIVAHNDSPDIGFRHSVNPYRGCQHACIYCYARPGHEYLSLGAGTDFETKLFVKPRAPELLREQFEKRSWKGETIAFSGVTDCYQPLEASYRLTRRCLEVCAEYRNPVSIITKAALIERDLDVLVELHRVARVSVMISVPFWDDARARAIEPYAPTPQRRIRTIARLAAAGIRVGVMVAPVIPGLNDDELPKVLAAARAAGATRASWILLRLPGSVKEVFEERLRALFPERAERVLHLLRETRDGKLYDLRFGHRQRGTGPYADSIAELFESTCKRLGYDSSESRAEPTTFERPRAPARQLVLFPTG